MSSWKNHRETISRLIMTEDIANFINWYPVRRAMFSNVSRQQLIRLKASKYWDILKDAIIEDKTGNPPRCKFYPQSSTNLINQAYSLMLFLENSNIEISGLRRIFEFGGGYGSLCRLIYKAGFKGEYIIYDLPEITMLQAYFLKNTVPEADYFLINEITRSFDADLFIGLWSLSEVFEALRNQVFSLVPSNNYMLAFQDEFEGIDNFSYFKDITGRLKPKYWAFQQCNHAKSSFYLFGYGS